MKKHYHIIFFKKKAIIHSANKRLYNYHFLEIFRESIMALYTDSAKICVSILMLYLHCCKTI